MKKLKPIMFVGTGSDVGKSVINAAFCRIFLQDGYHPAPFKAQNMSLNSFATTDGLEIGRAQAVQAEACGIDCRVEMNPILLKPTSYLSSQVIQHGKPIGNKTASEYFEGTDRDMLFAKAISAFNKLHISYNPIVIEGAGSISEINLWEKDITNMRVAEEVGASCYLIADIDRGGVFGSVFGTLELLPQKQKDLIKGVIINKFRGDIVFFKEGKTILEELTGKPVVGIIPHFRDIFIEQEDSVVIDNKKGISSEGKINIAVVLLRHMSNFTDFSLLEHTPGVHLYYTADSEELALADIVILPGSKNTISDLQHLRKTGMAKVILNMHKQGKSVYGICGGYQMMGEEIHDPDRVEGDIGYMPGLSILPVATTLTREKKTTQCTFSFLNEKERGEGYEIHMGITNTGSSSPLCITNSGHEDGYFLNSKTWGTYIHGILDNEFIVQEMLSVIDPKTKVRLNYKEFKEQNFDMLADLVRNNVDMGLIYKAMI